MRPRARGKYPDLVDPHRCFGPPHLQRAAWQGADGAALALPDAFDRFIPSGRTGRADPTAPDVAEWTKTGGPGEVREVMRPHSVLNRRTTESFGVVPYSTTTWSTRPTHSHSV